MSGRPALLAGSSKAYAPRLALVLGIAAVSSGSIFARFAQADAPSLVVAAFRLSLAVLLLLPLAWLRYRRELRELNARDWRWLLAAGFFLAVHFATWITSLEYTSVASSVALVSTSPLWVALFSWIVLREPVKPSLVIGLALALCGSVVISFAEARAAISTRPLLGNALALAGAMAVSGYWLIGRRMRRGLALVPYVTVVYGSAALLLLAAAAIAAPTVDGIQASDLRLVRAAGAAAAVAGPFFFQLGPGAPAGRLRGRRHSGRADRGGHPGLPFPARGSDLS